MPLSTLRATPHDGARKTQGQDGYAALLSCRALSSPTTFRFIPALAVLPPCRRSAAQIDSPKSLVRHTDNTSTEVAQPSVKHLPDGLGFGLSSQHDSGFQENDSFRALYCRSRDRSQPFCPLR